MGEYVIPGALVVTMIGAAIGYGELRARVTSLEVENKNKAGEQDEWRSWREQIVGRLSHIETLLKEPGSGRGAKGARVRT